MFIAHDSCDMSDRLVTIRLLSQHLHYYPMSINSCIRTICGGSINEIRIFIFRRTNNEHLSVCIVNTEQYATTDGDACIQHQTKLYYILYVRACVRLYWYIQHTATYIIINNNTKLMQ